MPQPKFILFKTILSIIIFVASAVVSTYFYCTAQKVSAAALNPGIIYTSCTLVVFAIFSRVKSVWLLLPYYALMVATYFVVWIGTLYTVYFAFIAGIVTAGIGALLTFKLTSRFVTPIKFTTKSIMLTGGLSFLLTDIVLLSLNSILDTTPVQYIFTLPKSTSLNDIGYIYAEEIFFWQILVGIKLVLTLRKDINKTQNAVTVADN